MHSSIATEKEEKKKKEKDRHVRHLFCMLFRVTPLIGAREDE